jgi:hypothetical protein
MICSRCNQDAPSWAEDLNGNQICRTCETALLTCSECQFKQADFDDLLNGVCGDCDGRIKYDWSPALVEADERIDEYDTLSGD